ncbi:MAG TPA: lipocalin family protein [Thermoanaerobaculia bacterium]|nr:lipocalin family protein [Thermoanaerobaculia bacterium]
MNVEWKRWLTIGLLLHSTFNIQHSTFAAEQAAFQPALPGYDYSFPRDHGTHDDYKTEWWYYTGHLDTDAGKRYGFELTFFRVGIVPPGTDPKTRWDLRNVSLAHFAITDVSANEFRYYEKLNRTSPFTAGAAAGTLDVFNEGWRAVTLADGSWRIIGYGGHDAIDLVMTSRKAPAIHGENGISVKAEGAGYASHYYSMTRLEVRGRVNGANCHGAAWMDHEFGSSVLRENQQGWDWFSVQLDNDAELMLYQIRRKDGTSDPASSGSLISSEGNVIHLRREQISMTPTGSWHSKKSNATYPMGWRIAVPSFGIALTLQPVMKDQELVTSSATRVTYWEGAVDAAGTFGNVAVNGRGYVEMTGYERAFRAP